MGPMTREVAEEFDIGRVYRDKAHDNRSFILQDDLNIEPAVSVRQNPFQGKRISIAKR